MLTWGYGHQELHMLFFDTGGGHPIPVIIAYLHFSLLSVHFRVQQLYLQIFQSFLVILPVKGLMLLPLLGVFAVGWFADFFCFEKRDIQRDMIITFVFKWVC